MKPMKTNPTENRITNQAIEIVDRGKFPPVRNVYSLWQSGVVTLDCFELNPDGSEKPPIVRKDNTVVLSELTKSGVKIDWKNHKLTPLEPV